MKRRSITAKERVAIFNRWGGVCHICKGKIEGKGWDVEHVIPLAQGGEDGGDNLRPAHIDCHKEKTAVDAADTAKAKRREAKHIGAWKPKRPFPKRQKEPFKSRHPAMPRRPIYVEK